MTFKSVLGFGYNNVRNKTVGSLISLGRHKLLIKAYYGLEKINFVNIVKRNQKTEEDLR